MNAFPMARRHWLDPLARQLLRATGQLPAPPRDDPQINTPPSEAPGRDEPLDSVERELMALRLRHDPSCALRNADEVAHAAALGWRLDVNRASASDWRRLPGIHDAQVDLLLRLQGGGVQLSGAEDLQRLLELSDAQLQLWLPVLEFRWYGEPAPPPDPPTRLDLNRAQAQQLQELGLADDRLQRLLRERARQPFRDLADLQQRLGLPASLVEGWIGKVCFGAGPQGPRLPPGPKRR
jgi:DNA uptake protein ComE-like DNA-binding protein